MIGALEIRRAARLLREVAVTTPVMPCRSARLGQGRRSSAAQVREPPAYRVVQGPRCLRAGGQAAGAGAFQGRRHRERRQPRLGVALAAARFGTRATVWMPAGAPRARSPRPPSSGRGRLVEQGDHGRPRAGEGRGRRAGPDLGPPVRRPRRDRRTGDGRARAGPPASRAGHGRGARRWWRAAGRRGRGGQGRQPARTSSRSRRPVPWPSPTASLDAGAFVTLDRVATMADGIAVAQPGELPLAMATLVDGMVTVTDEL